MRCSAALVTAMLFVTFSPAVRAADEEDPTVLNKKASEWMQILKTDKEAKRRRVALLALDTAGPRTRKVFGAVGGCLREDADDQIRAEAAYRLGSLAVKAQMDKDRVPTDEAVDFLIQAVKSDKVPTVREAAARALTKIGLDSRDAVEVLGVALKEAHPGLRAAAAECLGRLEYLYRLDKNKSLILPVLPQLLVALKESKGKEFVEARRYVIYAIGRLGGPDGVTAVPALVELLNEADIAAENRRNIAETLGLFGKEGASATAALAKLLQDKDLEVQRTAAAAIDRLGIEARLAIPDLIKAVSGKDRFVRSHSIHALGQMGKELGDKTPLVIQLLRDCLKDNLPDVRLSAINSLAALGAEVLGKSLDAVKSDLRVALRDTSGDVRDAAATALKTLEGTP